jgi:hypothetical protein
MAGLIAPNFMVLGQMGSGKSHYIRQLLEGYKGKYQYLVVLNTSEEFREFCNHGEEMSLERLEKRYTAAQLATLIKHHGSVHFEISECDEMFPFLDVLGEAVMSLGIYNADGCTVLLLTDEKHTFTPKNNYVRGFKRIETEGRKYGIHQIQATQTLIGSSGYVIHHSSIRAANVWVVFPTSEVNSKKRLFETLGNIPDPANYAMPDAERKWGPEYFIFDRRKNRKGFIKRHSDGSRRYEEVSA